jgi:hypothetical protein
VTLLISVNEGGVKNNWQGNGGHWFIVTAKLTPIFLENYKGITNLGLLKSKASSVDVEYYFSDRKSTSNCSKLINGVNTTDQPFDLCKVENGKLSFLFTPMFNGQISNINLFTNWDGWSIKTAVMNENYLYGTLENGDIYTISFRIDTKSNNP